MEEHPATAHPPALGSDTHHFCSHPVVKTVLWPRLEEVGQETRFLAGHLQDQICLMGIFGGQLATPTTARHSLFQALTMWQCIKRTKIPVLVEHPFSM